MISHKASITSIGLDNYIEELYLKAKSDYLNALHVESKQSSQVTLDCESDQKSVALSGKAVLSSCNSKPSFAVPSDDESSFLNLENISNSCIKSAKMQSVSESNITTNHASNISQHITSTELKANQKVNSACQSSNLSQHSTLTSLPTSTAESSLCQSEVDGSLSDNSLNHSSIPIESNLSLPSNTDKLVEKNNVNNSQSISSKSDFASLTTNTSSASTSELCEKEQVKSKESVLKSDFNTVSNLDEKSQPEPAIKDQPSDSSNEKCTESKVIVQMLPSVASNTISALMGYSGFSKISRIAQRFQTFHTMPWATCKKRPSEDSSSEEGTVDVENRPANTKVSPTSDDYLRKQTNNIKSRTKKFRKNGSLSSEESSINVGSVTNKTKISPASDSTPSMQRSKRKLKKNKFMKKSVQPIRNLLLKTNNGIKLSDINQVATELAKSPAQVLRILHYLLFGTYGLTSDDSVLQQTRENILQFSGFHLAENSAMYSKKRMTLLNLPYPLLVRIHDILLNSPPLSRDDAVSSLLQFLQSPTDKPFMNEIEKDDTKQLSESDIRELKTAALKAQPFVLLRQLSVGVLEEIVKEEKIENAQELSPCLTSKDNYLKPSFVKNGQGRRLKTIPEIAHNIQTARRRIINILHSLLYGRPGSDGAHRQNILEFNGFTDNPRNFVGRRMTYLNRLKAKELTQICDVFALRVKASNKNMKIKTILQFLDIPSDPCSNNIKRKQNKRQLFENTVETEHNTSTKEITGPDHTDLKIQEVKLRDFPNICSKIECASPQDLLELNDLLFVKPCETSEIHQKILDFTSFPFTVNSFDFHYRKTLMHYMNFKTVQKIAELLQIDDWETYRSPHDLSQNILNFLMNMKLPDKKRKSAMNLKKRKMKSRPHIMMLHSSGGSKNSPKSGSSSPDCFDSTYASEELNENECELTSSTPNSCKIKRAQFRHRQRRDGAFSKDRMENDSTPLFEIVQHPTDKELYHEIDKVISSVPFSLSLGELVKKVLKSYPNFNLHYRVEFIRNKALEILRELRENAVI